jgi:putative ABC transport system permease protein
VLAIRQAGRALRRARAFTALAALMLALAAGPAGVLFHLVRAGLATNVPFPHPNHLFYLTEMQQGTAGDFPASGPDFKAWQANTAGLATMAAFVTDNVNIAGPDGSRSVSSAAVSPTFFRVLGGRSVVGRADLSGSDEIIISERLGRSIFPPGENVIGRRLLVNGAPVEVVGVIPARFDFPPGTEAWTALDFHAKWAIAPGRHWASVIARVSPGVAQGELEAALHTISARLAANDPRDDGGIVPRVISVSDWLTAGLNQPLNVLGMGTVLILISALAGLAALFSGRFTDRAGELRLKFALGARPTDLVRDILTECAILGLIGGGVAIPLGFIINHFATAYLTELAPNANFGAFDFKAVVGTLCIALLLVMGIGWIVVRRVVKSRRISLSSGFRFTAQPGRVRALDILAGAQVAAAVATLVAGGLLLQSLRLLYHTQRGFDTSGVETFGVYLPSSHFPSQVSRDEFLQSVSAKARTLPGVDSVGWTSELPLNGSMSGHVQIAHEGLSEAIHGPVVEISAASPGYFRTIGIEITHGRAFSRGDITRFGTAGALVNATMARRFWPDHSAVGERFRLTGASPSRWYSVVGVFRDIPEFDLSQAAIPQIFLPVYGSGTWEYLYFAAHTSSSPPSDLANSLVRVVTESDPSEAAFSIEPLESVVAGSLEPPRIQASLVAIFAALVLALAVGGVYGTQSYTATRRLRDLAIRSALGARPEQLILVGLRSGVSTVGCGLAVGLLLSVAAGQVLRADLYKVPPRDPWILVGAALISGAGGIIAAYLPASRAARVEPASLLREG